jgi:hypothetical protein
MRLIRHAALCCLLSLGLWSALVPHPRLERAPKPDSDVQVIRPATPEESLRADLYRLLDTPNAEVVP